MNKFLIAGVVAALGCAGSTGATEFITNGGFEANTGTGQVGFNTAITAWYQPASSPGHTGYNFLYAPGTADTTGAVGQYGVVRLWGPNDGSNNGLPATSPDGGYYVASDGPFNSLPLDQNISGLTVGNLYVLKFDWAGAQQYGYTGPTTEGYTVSLGGQSFSTPIVNDASHGFTGWTSQTFTFTADSTNEVLSFLATGSPVGVPPFSVLDGVSLTEGGVPEPTTWVMMLIGVAGMGAVARRRRSAAVA